MAARLLEVCATGFLGLYIERLAQFQLITPWSVSLVNTATANSPSPFSFETCAVAALIYRPKKGGGVDAGEEECVSAKKAKKAVDSRAVSYKKHAYNLSEFHLTYKW